MDQSNRYLYLDVRESDLLDAGSHVLAAYHLRQKPGHDFRETCAHFAAESSTGTNVEVCTTDRHTRTLDALVYHADEATGLVKIA